MRGRSARVRCKTVTSNVTKKEMFPQYSVPFSCAVAGCGHKSWKKKKDSEILFFPKRGKIKAKMDKSSEFTTQELQVKIEIPSM